MIRGISNRMRPLELPNRVLSPCVKCARHASALDDERITFHPVLLTEQWPGQPTPPLPALIEKNAWPRSGLSGCMPTWAVASGLTKVAEGRVDTTFHDELERLDPGKEEITTSQRSGQSLQGHFVATRQSRNSELLGLRR
jgi:hypothetical protein